MKASNFEVERSRVEVTVGSNMPLKSTFWSYSHFALRLQLGLVPYHFVSPMYHRRTEASYLAPLQVDDDDVVRRR